MKSAFVSETFLGEGEEREYQTVFRHKSSLKDSLLHIPFEIADTVFALAANAYKSLQNSTQTISYQEALHKEIGVWQKKKEKDLEECNREWKEKLSVLEKQLTRAKGELEAAEVRAAGFRRSFEESNSLFSSALEQVSKEKAAQSAEEIKRLSALLGKQLESAEERARKTEERMRAEHKEEIEGYRRQLEKSFVSSEKGKAGEMDLDQLALQYTSWPPLENTSKIDHSCDRQAKIYGYKVMFETKKYSEEVGTKEVTKFLRDMNEHPDAVMGVFISYNSGIVGKKANGFIQMEWNEKNQLLLYINRAMEHDPADIFRVIDMLIGVAGRVYKLCEEKPEESDVAIRLAEKISRAKSVLEKMIVQITGMKRQLGADLKRTVAFLTEINTNHLYLVDQSLASAKMVLDFLLGEDTENVSEESSSVPALAPAFQVNMEVGEINILTEPAPAPKKKGGRSKKSA